MRDIVDAIRYLTRNGRCGAQTARKEFIIRAGLEAVSQYEAECGPFTPHEIVEADEWATRVTQPAGPRQTA